MKNYILVFFCLMGSYAFGQSFHFPHPEGWGEEMIPFPIDFALGIPYRGQEHLRFSPGWGDPGSEEFWSYAFLWWVNPDAPVTQQSLEQHLKEYYSGLVGRNITSRSIDRKKVVPVVATFKEMSGYWEGTVSMLDYMDEKPIVLNVKVQQQLCDKAKHKAIFISVSPQPRAHAIWTKMNSLWTGFRCSE